MSGHLLHSLRDVPGVTGSFACNSAGRLLVSDWPLDEVSELDLAARSVLNLLRLGQDSISDCDRLSCAFVGGRLEVLSLDYGFLCVVVQPSHDENLLSAAMRMVARRFLQAPPSRPRGD